MATSYFPPLVLTLRDELRRVRAHLLDSFFRNPQPRTYLRGHTRLIDTVIQTVRGSFTLPKRTTLIAVGGYGRSEQYPHSDVDLLVLLPGPIDSTGEESVASFVRTVGDLGFDLGSSVRTVDECVDYAKRDISIQTALLEMRPIHGSRSLYGQLQSALKADMDPESFFEAKILEQQLRHGKSQNSPFSLEPNIKEGAGGLRDLHILRWILRGADLAKTWQEAAEKGVVTPVEAASLARCHRLLQQTRIRLHGLTERKNDFLRFEYQTAIAEQTGISPAGPKAPCEIFMQDHYRNVRRIMQHNTILLQSLRVTLHAHARDIGPTVINERFQSLQGLLDIRSPSIFKRYPSAMLECFLVLQQRPELKGMTARSLRALWLSRPYIDKDFRNDPRNRALFLDILRQPRGVVHELRRMNQYGILGRYLPPFQRIVGQLQHDLIHVYAVDQHILMVIRNLRRFTMPEFAHEFPYCTRLMAGYEKHWLLYVAALFHDIAKGRGGDHSLLGRREAIRFCRTHGLAADDLALITFLVEHHLTLSTLARRGDLSDPMVIRHFVRIVKTERRLVGLYLLTVADMRATNPNLWSAWTEKLLNDLYFPALRLIQQTAPHELDEIDEKQAETRRRLRLYELSEKSTSALWRELDIAYFMRHNANELAWHARTLHYRVRSVKPVVRARLAPIGDGIEVLIYCRDRSRLFSHLCGIFASLRYNVLEAKIHTTRHGYALDSFLVVAAGPTHYSHQVTRSLEDEIQQRVMHENFGRPPSASKLSRRAKHFPISPKVRIETDDADRYHVLTITTHDRPLLLCDIVSVLADHEVNVRTAKIVTLGELVEDVFVLQGESLKSSETILELERAILGAAG